MAGLLLGGCTTSAPVPERSALPVPPYDFPFDNPWVATVVGTPSEQRGVFPIRTAPQRRKLVLFPERTIPEGFWYYDGMDYSVLLQSGPAPLVFVIGGTGADDRSRLMLLLGRIMHAGGSHVILIPSPSHANFIVTASSNFLPGRAGHDASDLLRVMHALKDRLAGEIQVTRYDLAGYSLGAWHAAFVAKADAEREDRIGFDRVLLLNPPLSLYRSIEEIDAMLYKGLPNGIDGLRYFLNQAGARLSHAYSTSDPLDFSDQDFLFEAYSRMQPSDESLATTVGLAFRFSTMNLIFTSDVMGHAGYVFPFDKQFRSTTPLGDYMAVAMRLSFMDYFNDIYVEQYANETVSRQDLIDQSSLEYIRGWLSRQTNIYLLTNSDDIILAKGDLEILVNIFQERSQVYPNGGHMGNLAHRSVTGYITRFFTA
ncbi:MAG TPA: hypothetical protein VHL31_08720 [Geminicoccus sp.]|uniref:hypothetical protein n=1 Tax=Geminicoccus sp. TaxID=2024832 RepID=UPI002E360DF4|nr:hypothetical protein [Geminicoccus sp.]HEX2526371.1 hypothetical protein [Geminicoccus sp.]